MSETKPWTVQSLCGLPVIMEGEKPGPLVAIFEGTPDLARENAARAVRAVNSFDALLSAAKAAEAWEWDPDDAEQFDRIADEFYRDTGQYRPGKDIPVGGGMTSALNDERMEAWQRWTRERSAKVLADLRAALKAAGVGT